MSSKPKEYPEKYTENILLLLKWREKINIEFLENEKNDTDECPNFKVCGNKINIEFANDCYHGRCIYCDMEFGEWRGGKGNLIFEKEIECPICFETKSFGTFFPKCNHIVCTECFKKCFYPKLDIMNPFPYPDLENEYDYIESLLDWIEFQGEEELYEEDKLHLKKEEKIKYKELISNEERELFKWLEDEKIKEWKEQEVKIRERENEKYEETHNLRRCPICRK